MTKLRDVEISDEVVDVLRQFVMDADDEDILAYAQYGNNGLLKGLRPTKENAERIKNRFVKQLSAQKKVSKENAGFLRRHNPYSFFDGLEEKTVLANLDALCATLGTPKVMAVLLLSDRPELIALAARIISGKHIVNVISAEDVKTFAARTFHEYLPFMFELRGIFDSESTEEENAGEETEEESSKAADSHSGLEEECNRLKEKLNRLKSDLKEYKRDATRAHELDKKLTRSERQCAALSETVNGLKQELHDARIDLEQLHAAISSTVSEELNSSLHSWLREPAALLAEVEKNPSADLTDRARQIIAKQEEIDRNAGNRRVLSDRLHTVRDLRDHVNALCRNSLNPLSELAGLLDELNAEANRLRSLLGFCDESEFIQNFMARIGQAGSPDDVAAYRQLLTSLNDARVLDREDLRLLFEYCDRRMDLAYDKRMPEALSPGAAASPFHSLKEAVVHNHEMIWLLDGHNILHALTDLFGELDSKGNPTEESRYRLSDALVALVGKADQCQIRLYYDGPERSEYSPSENVKVIYSGGEGDHKADRAVCAYLEYLRRTAPQVQAFVTTDDRDLRSRSTDAGANALSIDELYILLRNERVSGSE